MPTLDRDTARSWITRWDRQQELYLPDREDRFTVMIDAVESGAGRRDPLVLDLGCGPGSLAGRLLGRLPAATVVAVDGDPVLLALGRVAESGRCGLRFIEGDLRVPGWGSLLGLDRPADAAVSTTALHWLTEAELGVMYGEVAALLRPGGLLLNGDHFVVDEPALARLERGLMEAQKRRTASGHQVACSCSVDGSAGRVDGSHENWPQWWAAVASDPGLAELSAERRRCWAAAAHHGTESGRLAAHVAAMRAAGFCQIGTLWQRAENRVLCALRA